MTDINIIETDKAGLFKALAAAQSECKNPRLDGFNPHFKSKFSTLSAVKAAVVPIFNKHGLSITTPVETIDGVLGMATYIHHESGCSYRSGHLPLLFNGSDMQKLISATTYARRISYQLVSGVVGDEDDDGNSTNMTEKEARKIADMVHAVDLDTGEGVDAFGEAWIEMGQQEQLQFGKYISTFWPGGVSKAKQKMRDIMDAYRKRLNSEEAA